jgi:hypothetical protein
MAAESSSKNYLSSKTVSMTIEYEDGCVKIYTDKGWQNAIPYVYNGSEWKQCIPYVYNGSEWKQCTS